MYNLTIVTPEEIFFEQETTSLVAPGSEGYLGVLTDHAPLITTLVPGKVTINEKGGKELVYAIGGGFLEVFKNQVTILAYSIESIADIDYDRARQALERANRRLQSRDQAIDITRAMAAWHRARNRCRLYELIRLGHAE